MFELIYRYDPARNSERLPPTTSEEAKRRLQDGNGAFAGLATGPDGTRVVYMTLEDLGIAVEGGAPKQMPFAVVLGCSDARVPIELIFDRACNELFVVRVAGNVLGQEELGSIDYAVQNLGTNLKLLVVLGHSKCGAVTAAVDAYLQPGDYLALLGSHHVRAIVNDLMPAVRAAATSLVAQWGEEIQRRKGFRAALIETAVAFNAALTAGILRAEFMTPDRDLRVVFGVYDLSSRRVQVPQPDRDGDGKPDIRLIEPPEDLDATAAFAADVAASPLIRELLGV